MKSMLFGLCLAAALPFIVARSAAAQEPDLKAAIAKCAVVTGNPARLDCFDALTRSQPHNKPATSAATVQSQSLAVVAEKAAVADAAALANPWTPAVPGTLTIAPPPARLVIPTVGVKASITPMQQFDIDTAT